MDLTAWLLRRTPPCVFVLTTPGGDLVRFAVERVVRERGWRAADSPAEANVLAVAGPRTPDFDQYVERVWESMPGPRARTHITEASEAANALAEAAARMRDVVRQKADSPSPTPRRTASSGSDMEHSASCADHSGHGHHMSDMEMPGGIPMADRGEDRDGLRLDVLHVPLGPALPHWPAGLVVHTTVQGDVIRAARVELLAGDRTSWRAAVPGLVHRLDHAARLLAVAGWADAAATGRRLRDRAVDGATPSGVDGWARRVRRSRVLRWTLAGVGGHDGGDALTRLHGWLAGHDAAVPVDVLPDLLVGTELAAARLTVASLAEEVRAGG
ncbi:hypothetical protein [Saccharothrix obliqua]|uniref:hypothetical protein n=1 Tax=Saccharothrix obliqua TaxID=2861747 RepID=UPI001C5E33AC|nr:hypothetical protein [Saccharothrix obliqua]MBW4718662.1 hypothetical protein [Saccharothrix obliqua]